MSNRQTLEQKRAKQAYEAIKEVETQRDKAYHNDYGTWVTGLPSMIQVNGLSQTLAFLRAKGASKPAADGLFKQLQERTQTYFGTKSGLMEYILDCSTDEYRRATAETIAYANWLKRFVEAKGWKSSENSQ